MRFLFYAAGVPAGALNEATRTPFQLSSHTQRGGASWWCQGQANLEYCEGMAPSSLRIVFYAARV
jgi:hypothetical protein